MTSSIGLKMKTDNFCEAHWKRKACRDCEQEAINDRIAALEDVVDRCILVLEVCMRLNTLRSSERTLIWSTLEDARSLRNG